MGFYCKFLLCAAVVLCVFQATSARPRLDGNFLENVKFDLLNKCMNKEKDVEKAIMNTRHKITKESMKLMKKALKSGSPDCVESAKLQAEDTLEERSEDMLGCVRDLKDSLDGALEPEAPVSQILAFRSDFKNKVNACKNSAKQELKSIENSFSVAGKSCLA